MCVCVFGGMEIILACSFRNLLPFVCFLTVCRQRHKTRTQFALRISISIPFYYAIHAGYETHSPAVKHTHMLGRTHTHIHHTRGERNDISFRCTHNSTGVCMCVGNKLEHCIAVQGAFSGASGMNKYLQCGWYNDGQSDLCTSFPHPSPQIGMYVRIHPAHRRPATGLSRVK